MANELRVRQNFLGGLIEDNPLTSGATTLTSAALAAMVAIGSASHMPIVLDPDGVGGEPEIVWVTAHTAAATTATILRGQEGTTARAHNRDVPWSHGPTKKDGDDGMTLLYEVDLAATTATVTISSIPQTYRHLVLYATARTNGGVGVGPYSLQMQLNGDTGSNYTGQYLRGSSSSASSGSFGSVTAMNVGLVTVTADTASRAAMNKIELLDYTGTTFHKVGVGFSVVSTGGVNYADVRNNIWLSTAAVTSLLLKSDNGSFIAGTSFSLYGVK